MNACLDAGIGKALGSTLEHPASRSAMDRWARIVGQEHVLIPHDNLTSTSAQRFEEAVTSVQGCHHCAYITCDWYRCRRGGDFYGDPGRRA